MSDKKSSRNVLLLIIGIAVLVIVFVGVTFAFFNYTRTGASNVIKVGRISFISKNEQTITLNNLFPIDPSNTSDMNDSTKVGTYTIDITGDTDYVDGIEYLVSVVDANIYTNQGQIVPISLDVTVDDLGTSNVNYFTARESKNATIYKKLVGDTLVGDQMLLVGYIKPNTESGTAEGVDGSITIKAYLDENNILISDTYDGTESDNMGTPNSMAEGKTVLTTSEWNAIKNSGVSFKVKVEANEGIWVIGSLEEIMKRDNIGIDTENGVDFSKTSEQDGTNGEGTKGIYTFASTQNDTNPVLYYRGAVENNNVIFANQCWKAVRTTDTGGVKLIYNGERSYNSKELERSYYGDLISNTGNFTFDTTNNTWNNTIRETQGPDDELEVSFSLPIGKYTYQIYVEPSIESNSWSELDLYINDTFIGYGYGDTEGIDSIPDKFSITTSNSIVSLKLYGEGNTSTNPSNVSIKFFVQDATLGGDNCNNSEEWSLITLNESGTDTNAFAFSGINLSRSPAYVGYMYGTVYEYDSQNWIDNAKFGSGFTWDGTNYKLVNATRTSPNENHHYSCNQVDANGTCNELRYVYHVIGTTKHYVTLTGGDGIEEAIAKMQINTTNSNAKDKIDTWYANNLTNYTNKLEDTIWCNDRSMGDGNNNGWIANGGDLSTYLTYGATQRSNLASQTSTVKNRPSLSCVNKNDRFTVNSEKGNKALTYPVALLTEDEIVLAGGVAGVTNGSMGNELFYLTNGESYWSLSPGRFGDINTGMFDVNDRGYMTNVHGAYQQINGLRPSVSIKPSQLIVKGDGTVNNPYIIE